MSIRRPGGLIPIRRKKVETLSKKKIQIPNTAVRHHLASAVSDGMQHSAS